VVIPDVKGGSVKERRNIKARKENLGNVPHLPKKKSAKDKKEEWESRLIIRPAKGDSIR